MISLFFSSRRRHTRSTRDWSSDVCSSDLQLTEKLLEAGFDVTTMTRYRSDFDCPVAFAERQISDTLAEVLSEHGVREFHVAETEKYARVHRAAVVLRQHLGERVG